MNLLSLALLFGRPPGLAVVVPDDGRPMGFAERFLLSDEEFRRFMRGSTGTTAVPFLDDAGTTNSSFTLTSCSGRAMAGHDHTDQWTGRVLDALLKRAPHRLSAVRLRAATSTCR